nr:PREDICTED: transcription elongation factor A protein 3 [Latimeria chalumnae]|eukprot:XP_014342219.1 PREDICTED: transcription elongation factor A protein 3 [Latimeria chalumnae]
MAREKELIRIAKQLDNMVARKNREGILGLLRELKGYSMTLKLLQTTRIGMAVNAVRKHCTDEEIAALAKILIKNWKRLLESPGSQKTERQKEGEREEKTQDVRCSKTKVAPGGSVLPLPLHKHSEKWDERQHAFESMLSSLSPPARKRSSDFKRERRDSFDSKFGSSPPCQKKHLSNSKKERKDSTDSKSNSHSATPKKHSLEIKGERSVCLTSSPPPKRPSTEATVERRDSSGSNSRPKHSSPLSALRKNSADTKEERSDAMKMKSEAPRTPTSPGSPVFSPSSPPFLPPTFLTGDSIRDKCIEMLAAALRTDDDYKEFGVHCDRMASEIEDCIYQEMKSTDMKYKNRVRSRISNLKDPKNPSLRKSVLSGAISLSDIAKMTAEEMASDELKELRNILTQEAIREHQMSKTGGTATDLFQCGKCKKKNCTYTQVQTRSADEPMTMFVLCNECGNRWKGLGGAVTRALGHKLEGCEVGSQPEARLQSTQL